ncbi:tRNA (N6-isopentenyl adenosine(37)-C2)-methylthiotransferase MiaB [Natronogracilivirga saccharolytica]|uniref:tRNA-2-methylthio-N(6)-dimethylallyladenosine synthase n=1 Tax=Natronogracilivirga saccharolytica TaxID=2812953 RepID=A0A8J7S347_9BACT|nr:tRNA (N6-isopentenyl adenosine(37)-C2)-methylthiotransferase MiaB [Natronogracilivirga saccharolytica]MBP3191188.1 tRNA (N6-isopentenyl adenosine(37)-C2)-methylthiotransferase MiaB [Natronogracilivirga saccharolytica]
MLLAGIFLKCNHNHTFTVSPETRYPVLRDRNFFIETYGCQMNFADSEIVNSIMVDRGMKPTDTPDDASVVFINTCSIRDNAEQKVWNRLNHFRSLKKKRNGDMVIGVLGCMAERLREKFLEKEKLVDIVVGPDAYRDIPKLLAEVEDGRKAVNVILSQEETYADITPVRTTGNGVSAFVSVMRGCDNMCSFCVVPFTRGRERSRPVESVIDEFQQLSDAGYKEVTLLGQNVNSYNHNGRDFAELMYRCSLINPEMRIRFSTSHPKDFPDEFLHVMRERHNVCNYIHIPVQSGNNTVLERMKRPYTREAYLELIDKMRSMIPGVSLSTDIIAGFCGETEEQHEETLDIIERVRYDMAYMFAYSERERTLAHRKYEDDVPEEVKKRRLSEIISLQHGIAAELNQQEIGRRHIVLAEGTSKRSEDQLSGRTDTNKMVIFDKGVCKAGDYVEVEIFDATSATLKGKALSKVLLSDTSPFPAVAL